MRTPPNESLTSDIVDDSRHRKSEPDRCCIISGEAAPRAALVRLAISPSGLVLPDAQEKAPGRGAWVSSERGLIEDTLANAKLKGALSRAFKTGDLEIPANLPEKIQDALTRVFLDRLGLEMRVGALMLGTQRIAETARSGGVALLLHANDSSEDGRKKLDQAWRVGSEAEGSGMRGWILPLDRDALSVALGRDNVVHLALAGDAAAARVLKPLVRLMHYLGHDIPADNGRAVPRADDNLNDTNKRNEQE